MFDGFYKSTKLGFYNFLLVLHAGVPRLIEGAWNDSGLENRVSLDPKFSPKHIIQFEKMNKNGKILLKNGKTPKSAAIIHSFFRV